MILVFQRTFYWAVCTVNERAMYEGALNYWAVNDRALSDEREADKIVGRSQ